MDPTPWLQRFSHKITTPEGAARAIPRGRRILIGSGAAEPARLVEAMVEHGHHLEGNDIVHLLTLGPAPYVKAGLECRFRHTAFFIGPNVRDAVAEGRADFMPVFLSDIPELIRSRRVRIDVALIQVSPPDAHGYVSLGVSVDIVRAAIDAADLILAEVNPRMPRTHGDSFLNVDRIQHLVPVDAPLPTRAAEPLDEVDRAIGRHIASLIPNGATLQTGIGRIPDAALAALGEHHDLGVHTEMFSDGVMRLALRGVINGRRKTLLPGKLVTSFVMGSQALYDWVHDNPAVEMRPSGFTNDPFIIAQNDMMIAINAALAVDLTGQVAADTLMGRFFSGIGGQVDFIRGSARSRGGKPIIALRSTAKEGQVSRIVPGLEQGAGVVTSRGDVHYVVTEHGIADLWGKNIRQRALALIDIAHPDHRVDLLAAAKQRHYVFGDQACARLAYPWEEARRDTLPGGHEVLVRPLRISDEDALKDLFYRLSDESTYQRFMKFKRSHPHEELLQLVCLDYEQNMGLVVIHSDNGCEEIIGLARYDVAPATRRADIAFVVRDEWQGRGVGTLLMRRMAEVARARGVTGFFADVLVSNKPMMAIFYKSGLPVKASLREGVYHVEIDFP
ncbi:bifunctional acetyl-CoA hydrolase/transferase family protein/GNAT family N-acetyltransferase [Polyangium sp. 15x6]|uniref:bifunctional acetyl-CoA hydrolase/transferase family protein/GNAT family N-acetyltransferase n=1 Tax=Polyangium sp. 15x6 TaxID=3042687 RepID=UPI00249B322B|nr:bifunctional acetyl-CoA hydrolase/transferase family protein/GNAT family N-acetyltransferase [Polyangium sp. 15x6]MDI3285616.1 GNAT family N-acetyltransferase [Polyangium sp. 15x6]